MSKKFVKFPPVFFHLDKDFSLFEKSKNIQFASQRLRDYATGLKFYALMYQEPAFTCAQIGLFQNLMVCSKSGMLIDRSVTPFDPVTREDLENNFRDPKNTQITTKITEKAFDAFLKSNLNQQFEVYANPKIVDYGKQSRLVKESSINFFYLQAQIERFTEITVLFDDENLDEKEIILTGQHAINFQKAFDYLQGKTILDIPRNWGRIEMDPVARQQLPEFARRFDELFAEIRMFTEDAESIKNLRNPNEPYPEFLEEEFDRQFDALLEEAVNEYEAKFDPDHE